MRNDDIVFTIIPPILESETVLSHVMRLAMLSTSGNIKPVSQKLFERTTLEPPLLIPSNLSHYCQEVAPLFSSPRQIILKHTLFPLFSPFLTPESRSIVTEHLISGSESKSVMFHSGLVSRTAAVHMGMNICPLCVSEDEMTHGFAYWHREHQLPGIGTCGLHQVAFLNGCGTCRLGTRTSRTVRLPRNTCWCGKDHRLQPQFETENARLADGRIAKMAYDALKKPLPETMRQSDWGIFYNSRCRALGYGRGKNLASPAIEAYFVERFGTELLTKYGAHGRQRCLWLRRAVTMVSSPASCLKHFLMADALFGSWDEYRDAVLEHVRLKSSRPKTSDTTDETLSQLGEQEKILIHRASIKQFLARTPSATRSETRVAVQTAYTYLYKFDKVWLDETIPPRWNKKFKGLESSDDYLKFLESELLASAVKMYQVLMQEKTVPRRITRRLLLSGATRGIEAVKGRFNLPRLDTEIAKMVESRLQYQCRRAKWIFDNPTVVPEGLTTLQFASHSTGLSQEKIALHLATKATTNRAG